MAGSYYYSIGRDLPCSLATRCCRHLFVLCAYIYAHCAQRVNRMKTTEQLIIAASDLPVNTELYCGYNWKGLVAS